MTSGDSFVLEMIVDNLSRTPKLIDEFIGEVAFRLNDINYRKAMIYKDVLKNQDDNDKAPLLKNTEEVNFTGERPTKLNEVDENSKPSPLLKDAKKTKKDQTPVMSSAQKSKLVDVEASKGFEKKPMICDSPPHYSFLETITPMDYGSEILDLMSSNIINEDEIIKSQSEALAKCNETVKVAPKKKNKPKKSKEQQLPTINEFEQLIIRTSTPNKEEKDRGKEIQTVLEIPSCPSEDESIVSLAHRNLNDQLWF